MSKRSYHALEATETSALEPVDVKAPLKRSCFAAKKQQRSPRLMLDNGFPSLSLASLMTQPKRSSLELFHAAAVRDLERHSNHVRFALPSFDENHSSYGYSDETPEQQPKRRRYQRRCSKTAAMLFPAATLQALDQLCDLSAQEPPEEVCAAVDEWDHRSSIDVAEDLVQELNQQHELRSSSSSRS